VIFTVYSQSPLPAAMLCHLAGIPRVLAHCRENPYGLISHWMPEPEPAQTLRHEVQRQVDLVRAVMEPLPPPSAAAIEPSAAAHVVGAADTKSDLAAIEAPPMQAAVSPQDRSSVAAILAAHGVGADTPFLVVHAGATAGSRCYPPAQFGESLTRLRAHLDWPIVLTGSDNEKAAVAQVIDNVAAESRQALVDLSGQLSLGELAALLERAAALLSNNSGPVHLAAALHTPVVVLYALTNPQHTPWRTPCRVLFHDVACRWCYRSICPEGHHRCLRGVQAETVVTAILDLLKETHFAASVERMSRKLSALA